MNSKSPNKTAERRAARKAANHESKRRQILDVAGDLFVKKGYANSSIDDIAAQLGVGKPFIYYYFSDKLAIFDTLCIESSELTSKSFDIAMDKGLSATERLKLGLYELILRYLQTFAGGAMYYKEPNLLSDSAQKKIRKNALKLQASLLDVLEAGRSQGEFEFENTKLTSLLIGGSIGFMFNWYQDSGKLSPEELAKLMVHDLLKIVLIRPIPSSAEEKLVSLTDSAR